MTFYIYKITNLINNKIYIGKTNNIDDRWKDHKMISKGGLKKYPNHFQYIHAAISKYGQDNFIINVIDENINENIIYSLEEKWIDHYKSTDKKNGYNLSKGGRGIMTGRSVSLKTRDKISKANLGKIGLIPNFSEDTLKVLSIKSKNNKGLLSLDQKKEIVALFNTGKYTKNKIAEMFEVTYESIRYVINYSKKNGFKTEEEKKLNIKLGNEKRRGKKLTEDHKKKVSNSLKGIIFTDERRKNISKGLKGKILSQEIKDKIAITLTGREDYIEIRNQIIELYNSNFFEKKEIAEKVNLNISLVRKIIKRYINKE